MRKGWTRTLAAAATVGAVGVATLATASPAMAATCPGFCLSAAGGSLVIYGVNGTPVLELTDTRSDGHSAVATIATGGHTDLYWNPNGAGTTKSWSLPYKQYAALWVCVGTGEYGSKTVIETSMNCEPITLG